MFPRAAKPTIRRLNPARVATWVLVLCTAASGQVAERQTPGALGGAPTVAATPAGSPTPNRHAVCEQYVAVLSGRKQSDTLMANPEVLALAVRVPELATCAAIGKDSERLCLNTRCQKLLRLFHELRTFPKGRSFMLPECYKMADEKWTAFCDSMLKALRSGEESQCSATGDGAKLCRAFIKLDPALCVAAKGLPEDLPKACKERIEAWGSLAKGLKGLEESGAPPELAKDLGDASQLRAFARSALGRPDACSAFAQAASDLCVKEESLAPGATPPEGESAPAAGSPGPTPARPQAVSRAN